MNSLNSILNERPQNSCFTCTTGSKISLVIGVITLIGGVLTAWYAFQYYSLTHWLFYAASATVLTSVLAFGIALILGKNDHADVENGEAPPLIYTIPQAQQGTTNGEKIEITVARHDLRARPEVHCRLLAAQTQRHVENVEAPAFKVTFHREGGIDSSGLTKSYLNELFSSLARKENLFIKLENGLVVPKSDENLEIYENIGKVMGYCSPGLLIGQYFDLSVFAIALNFTNEELNSNYQDLSSQRKRQLYEKLVIAQEAPLYIGESIDENTLVIINNPKLNLLVQFNKPINKWTDQELLIAIDTLENEGLIEEETYTIEGVKENQREQQELVYLLERVFPLLYDQYVRPLHALAKGIRAVSHKGATRNRLEANEYEWVRKSQVTPQEFSVSLQGRIDREFIIDHIDTNHLNFTEGDWNTHQRKIEEVNKKVGWLKEWILNGATESELREILSFITAQNSLSEDKRIEVVWQTQDYSPRPKTSTCFNKIYLSPVPAQQGEDNDLTKEAFIQSLKQAILLSGGMILRD